MAEPQTKHPKTKSAKSSDKESDKVNECDKNESKGGLFKLNGWKTTLLIVLVIEFLKKKKKNVVRFSSYRNHENKFNRIAIARKTNKSEFFFTKIWINAEESCLNKSNSLQVSLAIRSLIRSNKTSLYNRKTEGFLELVPETYRNDELFKWTPAPPPVSRPEEPGNLGNVSSIKMSFFLNYLNFFYFCAIGAAVVIPEHLKEEDKNRFKEHQFSIVANELMSMNRTMPDVRYPE